MATVVQLHPRAAARERQRELTGTIGMMVALGSWGMMFATLFFVYLGLRSQALAWPPPGLPRLPLGLPTANTVVMLASSATLARALRELRQGKSRTATGWMASTFALGCLFVGLQVLLWHGLWTDGITPATGSLGTVFYGLTVLHAVHVVAGLIVLAYLLTITVRGRALSTKALSLKLCGMFWHFVDAVWIAMFVGMFLL